MKIELVARVFGAQHIDVARQTSRRANLEKDVVVGGRKLCESRADDSHAVHRGRPGATDCHQDDRTRPYSRWCLSCTSSRPCPCSLSLFLSQFQSQLPQFQSRSLSVLSQLPLSQSYSQFLSMLLFHFSAAMAAVAAADQLLVFGVKNVIANKSPDALGLVDGDTTTVAITTPPP